MMYSFIALEVETGIQIYISDIAYIYIASYDNMKEMIHW